VDGLAARFTVRLAEERRDALDEAVKTRLPDTEKRVAEALRGFFEEAAATDDHAAAQTLHIVVQRIVTTPLRDALKQQYNRLQEQAVAYKRIETLRPALARDLADPAANLALGNYLCFQKGEWERGLPMLAMGSEQGLAELARSDLATPASAAEQEALGDCWLDEANANEGAPRLQAQRRAYHWYLKALPALDGDDRVRVERRVAELGVMGKWDLVELGKLELKDDAVRLEPDQGIGSRLTYTGPVEV